MGTLITSILESSFNKKLSSSYNLSALVSEDRFCFMVQDVEGGLILLRNYQSQAATGKTKVFDLLNDVFQKDELINLKFRSAKFAFYHHKQTLVPNKLFLKNEKSAYLEKVIDFLPDDHAFSDTVNALDLSIVYAFGEKEKALVSNVHENVQFFHGSTAFLEGILGYGHQGKGNQVYANLKDNSIHLVLFEDNDLLFSNLFSFSSSQDVLYYVLLVYDQFGLNPKSTPLHLAGQILKKSEIYNLLFRYIQDVQFVNTQHRISFGHAARELTTHQYFDLFSLSLCE